MRKLIIIFALFILCNPVFACKTPPPELQAYAKYVEKTINKKWKKINHKMYLSTKQAVIRVTIDKTGRLTDIVYREQSENQTFNKCAFNAVNSSFPLLRPPLENWDKDYLEVDLTLKQKNNLYIIFVQPFVKLYKLIF